MLATIKTNCLPQMILYLWRTEKHNKVMRMLQNTLNKIESKGRDRGIIFSAHKSTLVDILKEYQKKGTHGFIIPVSQTMRYLGVNLDGHLKFRKHKNTIAVVQESRLWILEYPSIFCEDMSKTRAFKLEQFQQWMLAWGLKKSDHSQRDDEHFFWLFFADYLKENISRNDGTQRLCARQRNKRRFIES